MSDNVQLLLRRIDNLEQALGTARVLLEAGDRGSTHWAGCEVHHPRCAWLKLANRLLEKKP